MQCKKPFVPCVSLQLERDIERRVRDKDESTRKLTQLKVYKIEKEWGTHKSCDISIQLSQPQECNGTTEGPADIMCHWCWHCTSSGIKNYVTPLWQLPEPPECNDAINHAAGIGTSTSTDIKCHIIPVNNHYNMTNVMVSLMKLSACDRKHVFAMYWLKLICPLNVHIYANYAN